MTEDLRLYSTFGMCEMECAAILIIKKIASNKSWDITFKYEDMREEPVGFLSLLYNGWFIQHPLSKSFSPSSAFVDRVKTKVEEFYGTEEVASWGLTKYFELRTL